MIEHRYDAYGDRSDYSPYMEDGDELTPEEEAAIEAELKAEEAAERAERSRLQEWHDYLTYQGEGGAATWEEWRASV